MSCHLNSFWNFCSRPGIYADNGKSIVRKTFTGLDQQQSCLLDLLKCNSWLQQWFEWCTRNQSHHPYRRLHQHKHKAIKEIFSTCSPILASSCSRDIWLKWCIRCLLQLSPVHQQSTNEVNTDKWCFPLIRAIPDLFKWHLIFFS